MWDNHVWGHVFLDLGKAYIVAQVSIGIPTCVGVLDCNLIANTRNTKEGFPSMMACCFQLDITYKNN